MMVLLYGVPVSVAERVADRYRMEMTCSMPRSGEDVLILVPPMSSPRRLQEFYQSMLACEEWIDAVIVCDPASCEAFGTVQYGSPQGKLFTVSREACDEDLEYAIVRIVETKLGRLCAHEGI
ncbi:hypothetical protein [Alistipes sp.]|uniref:hypothetical protein n=1 Tax=Alistipes sp. TaxID=1872444 RepID=UPI003A86F849